MNDYRSNYLSLKLNKLLLGYFYCFSCFLLGGENPKNTGNRKTLLPLSP